MSLPRSKSEVIEIPITINGYLVLPVQLPETSVAPSAVHYLYIRRHAPKLPTPDDERSLFVGNVPIDATEGHFRALFSSIGGGMVESVRFEGNVVGGQGMIPQTLVAAVRMGAKGKDGGKKRKRGNMEGGCEHEGVDEKLAELPSTWDRELRRSGSTAVVVFVDRSSCEMGLRGVGRVRAKGKQKKGKGVVIWGEKVAKEVPELGISRYLTHHYLTFPDHSHLQSTADAYITLFTAAETARACALARVRGQVDEDGFTMVIRGGRTAPAKQEEAQALLERKKKEEERSKNIGFYRFQTREGKREQARRLLEKFEVDKRRVEERKRMRKFKPL
ncbi:ribosomal RNA-processing protein 7-domain-containing protein [Kalaharituber pfeilii]|nr:ribosomal RNA-processing protein 7-domain-containing protein [Kalaharituber pfeilii]